MCPDDPLERAAQLSRLRDLARRPDPRSLLAEATAPLSITVRADGSGKEAFRREQRELEAVLGRPVPEPEALRWLLAFVDARRAAFLDEVARRTGRGRAS